jgi:hypothetical protein
VWRNTHLVRANIRQGLISLFYDVVHRLVAGVRRYAHLTQAKASRNAASINALLHVTNTSQCCLEGHKKGATEHRNPSIVREKYW